jgi:hypothetical protein
VVPDIQTYVTAFEDDIPIKDEDASVLVSKVMMTKFVPEKMHLISGPILKGSISWNLLA